MTDHVIIWSRSGLHVAVEMSTAATEWTGLIAVVLAVSMVLIALRKPK